MRLVRTQFGGQLWAGAIVFAAVLAAILLLPLILRLDPDDLDYASILTGPGTDHTLGTDALGRDLFARLLYGGRNSLAVGALVAALTASAGTAIGLIAASGDVADAATMRLMDVLMAFPALLLALAVLAALGNSLGNVVIALSLVYVPRTARIVRGEALATREMAYVEGARAAGASGARILVRHILPGVLPALMVQQTFLFAYAILGEAGLSFVGVGIQPPAPSWGNILGEARSSFQAAPWLAIWPSLTIAATVLGLNLMGDGLSQRLDPKRQRR
ncbi:MAG TPA: ABC transporter permease [Acetobacteraceae bacterium]|nr:ABC transporter permease [Acetobacteraceae bacterium]